MKTLIFAPFPILITERLLLRQLSTDDEHEIYFIRTDPELNRYVNKPRTNSLDDVRQFIEKINTGIENGESIYWVICIKETGQFAGTICLWNLDAKINKAETGYTLLSDFQGKGIMSEALKKVISYAFQEMKLNMIEAYTHKDNISSFKLLENCHFIRDETKVAVSDPDLIVYYLVNQTI